MNKRIFLFAAAVATVFAVAGSPNPAAAALLTNGPGDGTVQVEVDAFGSFGSSVDGATSDAFYDPVGSIGPLETTYESGIAINFGAPAGFIGPAQFLTSGDIGGSSATAIVDSFVASGDGRSATSRFFVGQLQFDLFQELIDSTENGSQVGTILNQEYTIRNTATPPPGEGASADIEIFRYLDADVGVAFGDDGGGVLGIPGPTTSSDNTILFTTDAASGANDPTTFIGITAVGGPSLAANRFEIGEFDDTQASILSGTPLTDSVFNDTDGDGFADTAFDVTLALRNEIRDIVAGGSFARYTTQTLFGDAIPPAPGSSQALPLLPSNDEPPFNFDIDVSDPGTTIWIDPPVSVGFEYEIVSGPNFASAEMPVGIQTDPFEILIFNGTDFVSLGSVNPGDIFAFAAGGVDLFRIAGIDPALGLDPANPLAFPTGLTFVAAGPVSLTMTPLTVTPVIAVPEPSALGLMIVGLVVFAAFARQRRADVVQ